MEYFNEFQLDVDFATYKRCKMKGLIEDGVPCLEIAKETGITYKGVWVSKDRFLKRALSKHMGEKKDEESN